MSLVETDKYEQYCQFTAGDAPIDFYTQINAVEQRVKEFLNRDLESTTYTEELYDGNGKNKLVLRQFPITVVTSIKRYDGIVSSAESWYTLVALTDYDRLIIPKESYSIILDNGSFAMGIQNYKITYTAGYSTMPEDIQLACKELVKAIYNNSPSGNNQLGFLSVSNSAGGGSQNLNLDKDIEMKILNKIAYHKATNV